MFAWKYKNKQKEAEDGPFLEKISNLCLEKVIRKRTTMMMLEGMSNQYRHLVIEEEHFIWFMKLPKIGL